jgi:hypothetical protein
VLACFDLADRLKAAETELEGLKRAVAVKSRDFSMLLDEAMGDGQ